MQRLVKMIALSARPPQWGSSAVVGALATMLVAAPVVLAPGAARAQFVCSGIGGAGGAIATGTGAAACGANAAATGDSSTAAGLNSVASGLESTADGFASLANGVRSTALGGRSRAGGTFSTAVGWANNASGLDAFAGGNKSVASGISSVAVGDVAQATGEGAVAIGRAATAQGANSVALGSGSLATDADTVSVGTDAFRRRITNAAAGTGANDVATFGQVQAGFAAVDARLSARADAGAAAAMAVAGLPQAFTPGKGMVALALGTWRGETAFAVGASKVFEGGRIAFKAGATFDGHGGGGVNSGIGFQF